MKTSWSRPRATVVGRLLALLTLAHTLPFAVVGRGWVALVGFFVALLLLGEPLVRLRGVPRPSPGMAMAFLSANLVLLATLCLYFSRSGSPVLVVADVVLLLVALHYVHTPEAAAGVLWNSLGNAFRLAIPVATIILLVFELYPDLTPEFSSRIRMAEMGFGTGGTLSPGDVASLSPSTRKAFVVRFPRATALPPPETLYWRGQVLTLNEGLRWRQGSLALQWGHREQQPAQAGLVRHEIRLEPRFVGAAFALDFPLWAERRVTGGLEPLRQLWGGVFVNAKVERNRLDVVASSDTRGEGGQTLSQREWDALTAIPSEDIRALARGILKIGETAPQALARLERHLREGGFIYSLEPGTMAAEDVVGFLTERKKGFCEHYAAASANLLRAVGIPARLVIGYWGGEWNPVDRSLQVHDSDAHAWLEAWDASRSHWIRFDPTRVLSPERFAGGERQFRAQPWWRYLSFVPAAAVENLGFVAEGWESLLATLEERLPELRPGAMAAFLAALAALLFGFPWALAKRGSGARERQVETLRGEFVAHLLKRGIEVMPADTVGRLAARVSAKPGSAAAADFARSYERARYEPGASLDSEIRRMRAALRALRASAES